MQIFAPETVEDCPPLRVVPSPVLGTCLGLDLAEFPELHWLPAYLSALATLQSERDRVSQAIAALTAEGDVYRDCWIEPYTKSKSGKQYTYYQLRWLMGERKKSGQPKVKTKHLSQAVVGQAQAAIGRGEQMAVLERQRQQIDTQINQLKHEVCAVGKRLKHVISEP